MADIIYNAKQLTELIDMLTAQLMPRMNSNVVFVGIIQGGEILANRVAQAIASKIGTQIPVGSLDISFYRDDISTKGIEITSKPSQIDFNIEGKEVILFDDVLYHGRTIRAALNSLFDFGRPAKVELAVLIDRGHRELPINPDYVAMKKDVVSNEIIHVKFSEVFGHDSVESEQNDQ
jgi:pyrimidine operon attenuation protein/uracil phosphoribosyltransferase